jgi:asparagine synthase (glutamine-hydrolysing)
MGGVLGLWNLDGRPDDPAVLGRLQATLSHRPDLECLAIPGADGTGPAIVFDGRLDNRDELLVALGRRHRVAADAPDRAFALAAYRAFGDHFAARLSGDFALGLFDPSRRTLLLARDALGVRPLYYHAARGIFLFASEIKAIVAHPAVVTRPNDDVLADYLLNLFAADDTLGLTFFQDVFSVLPAHLAIVTPGRVVTRRYWDFDLEQRLPIRSIEEAADLFREHFTRAVRRRLRSSGPVAVSVSGGLDSSAIFCTGERVRGTEGGRPLIGVSYVVPDGHPSDEKAFLADIERQYGVSITRWDDRHGGLMDGGRAGVQHLEGPLLEARWSSTAAYGQFVRDLGATTLLTGHWGDQFLVDDGFLVDLVRGGAWRTAARYIGASSGWDDTPAGEIRGALARALAREFLPERALSLARRVRDRFRAGHDLASWYTEAFQDRAASARRRRVPALRSGSAHARALHRTARSRYYVLCMEWNNKVAAMHGMDAAFPFLDRDLIAFLMAIPGELHTWQGVPKGLMREGLRGILPETIRQRRSKADFSLDVNTETARDYDKLVRCLRDGNAVGRGYLRPDRFIDASRLQPESDAESCTLSWALTELLALELWLEVFFGQSGSCAGTEVC